MGTWISYTLVAGITLLALYLFYDWFLAAENQPRFNRIVLLGCYAVSAIVPFVDITAGNSTLTAIDGIEIGPITTATIGETPRSSTPVWPSVLIAVYIAGVIAVTANTVIAHLKLSRLINSARKQPMGNYTLAVIDDPSIAPFSWRRYIVMNSDDYRDNRDLITFHETAHIDRMHRVDLVIARLFETIMWYNPAAWLMTSALRTVHEYEADHAVITHVNSPRDYQMLLIKKAVGRSFPVLANSLNHSNLKKRITMMLKPNSSKSRRVRVLALAPAVAVALLSVNLPFVANAIDTVSKAQLALNTNDKDTKNSPKEQGTKIYVDGVLSPNGLESIDPESIKEVRVTKSGEVHVSLYKPEEERRPSSHQPGDEIKVVSVSSRKMSTDDTPQNSAEVMPQFPGGDAALMEFMRDNIKFPESEMNRTGKFTVVVKFVVGADGAVRDAEIIRSQGEAFDAEALRVVNLLPNFTPGTTAGKPVAVSFTLPVRFSIKADTPAQQPK